MTSHSPIFTGMTFNDKLNAVIRKRNSLVCVGLDIYPERIPAHIAKADDPYFSFNREIINATADLVAAYKPNLAFYEALGREGMDVLRRTLAYIPDDVITIGDAKRGDIGTTAEKYAEALFDLGFDCVTVNPYLGWDSVKPFAEQEEKGVFILCLTSNPSSRDFQYITAGGKTLYKQVAEKAVSWNQNGNIGLVVGATHPSELGDVRAAAPDLPFLIPGIGAQGGDLEASVEFGTDKNNAGAVINSSRGILYASSGKDFGDASRKKTIELRDAINRVRS